MKQKRKKSQFQSSNAKLQDTNISNTDLKHFISINGLSTDPSENFTVLNSLQNDNGDIFDDQILEGNEWAETKMDTSRKRNRKRHGFIDEAARLAEIDANLYCGIVKNEFLLFL